MFTNPLWLQTVGQDVGFAIIHRASNSKHRLKQPRHMKQHVLHKLDGKLQPTMTRGTMPHSNNKPVEYLAAPKNGSAKGRPKAVALADSSILCLTAERDLAGIARDDHATILRPLR